MTKDEAEAVGTQSINDRARLAIVERDAWLDTYAAAVGPSVAGLGLASELLGGMGVLASRRIPWGLLNRALAIGCDDSTPERDVGAAATWLRDHCAPTWRMDIDPAVISRTVEEVAKAAGLVSKGPGIAKLRRGTSPLPDGDAHQTMPFDVRLIGPEAAVDFGSVSDVGFQMPTPIKEWLSCLVTRPRWHLYVAYDGPVPVATGALFINDEWAWLGWDSTLPNYRCRGAQLALIRRRVADGLDFGIQGFASETARPIPGQEATSGSYRNMIRAGFEPAYICQVYGPA